MSRETIFITGASAGIGAAMATSFAAAGWNVAMAARRIHLLEEVKAQMRIGADNVCCIETDISDLASCQKAINQAVERFGGVDVLVNNTGYLGPRTSIGTYDPGSFLQSLKVNILGTFQMIQTALPHVRNSSRGRIVSISSYLGRNGLPDCAGYVAGKFGVEGVTQALHHEEHGNGIVAVTLAPGMVATEMLQNYLDEEDVSEYRSPQSVGTAAVRCITALDDSHAGAQLDIDPRMEG